MRIRIHRWMLIIVCLLPLQAMAVDTERLERFFQALEENHRLMGAVTVLEGDRPVFQRQYGFVDEAQGPATPTSRYRIGSITKTYTATMILQLVEEGRLSLDDTLDAHFPSVPGADRVQRC